MNIFLDPAEARVLGCLVEKDLTTPEYYPLSLNALTNACNQKSNRDPLMQMSDAEVQATVDRLVKKHLVMPRTEFGARVTKYAHKLSNTLTKTLDFSKPELAVLCELLVRGPQTPGELRTRGARMHPFTELAEVETVLLQLATREDGPYATELPRQSGRREARWAQLFTGPVDERVTATTVRHDTLSPPSAIETRVALLEQQVAELRAAVTQLQNK